MKELVYQETLLYGQHSRAGLSDFARRQAFEERFQQPFSRRAGKESQSWLLRPFEKLSRKWRVVSETEFGRLVEDFVFLTALGIVVAILSFLIDVAINRCHSGRLHMLALLQFSVAAQFFAWIGFFIVFSCFAVGITHIIAPTAIGSGIPEVKTMIRGVVMKEYLTLRNLIAKVVGLTAALGSGLPVGKEGPFVHIAAASAALIAKALPSFSNEHGNRETRMADILTPASAVGLSCTFAAPVGGLLYSIEGTSAFFAMANYWRCFYASAVGTIAFRFLAIWFTHEETLTALERTYLPQDVPFDPAEVIAFLILGVLCGLIGAVFIILHKFVVVTIRSHKRIKAFLQTNRFIYPTIVAFAVGAILFPPGLGQFYAGELTNPEALKELFSNFTWSSHTPTNIDEQHVLHKWMTPVGSIFLSTALFTLNRLWMCAVATTCPLPCGLIVPAFTIGGGLGRLFGETMATIFPDGVYGNAIVPGGYALIGSAAFAGAVTHTFSPVIIIFELTGQIGHILPCLMAVMIANVVSRFLTPSVYECIIQLKKLPYLPCHIDAEALKAHEVLAEQIMTKDIQCLTVTSTYGEAYCLLRDYHFKSFPIVDSRASMLLKGAVERRDLKRIVEEQLSIENKLAYFSEKMRDARKFSTHLAPVFSLVLAETDQEQQRYRKSSSGKRFSITRIGDEPQNRKISTASATPSAANSLSLDAGPLAADDPKRKISCASAVSNRKLANFPDTISEAETDQLLLSDNPNGVNNVNEAPLMNDIQESNAAVRDRVRFKMSTTVDLHDPEKEQEWINWALTQQIDFRHSRVDPAPFQIVQQTSLYKIHHLFSLLCLHHTFVTDQGRLVGVISISEVREAVQSEVNTFVVKGFKDKIKSCLPCMGCVKDGKKEDRQNNNCRDADPAEKVPLETVSKK